MHHIFPPFPTRFWSLLGPKMRPQNSLKTKNDAFQNGSTSRNTLSLRLCCPKASPRCWKYMCFLRFFNDFTKINPFGFKLLSLQKLFQKWSQNLSKSIQNAFENVSSKLIPFVIDFEQLKIGKWKAKSASKAPDFLLFEPLGPLHKPISAQGRSQRGPWSRLAGFLSPIRCFWTF